MTKILSSISPLDGSIYAERVVLSKEKARNKILSLKRGQKEWAKLSIAERSTRVLLGVEKVGQMNDVIVPELAKMIGRPVCYGGEFNGFQERATYMAEIAEDALAPIFIAYDREFQRYIERTPLGTVLVIAPWNYPYMTAINTIAPALIAGNVVALKHATQTLPVGDRIAEAFHMAGIPEDVFQTFVLDHDTTSELIAENSFDFINFTGSVAAGVAIEKSAAGTFTGVGTELGGKDPAYVMDDANLENAVATLIDGAMFNSGQSCCGIERIYVYESLYDEFVKQAVSLVKNYKLGNPLNPETTIGPMAQKRYADFARKQIQEAVEMGAQTHIETFTEDDGGAYMTPQILTNVSHKMSLMRDETFAPVVGIMKVQSDEEAIALMNDSEFGLTASLWTTDNQRAVMIGNQIETGTVFMNRADYLDPALCWTGCKNSGRGGGLSMIGFHNLTRPKSFHFKGG